MQLLLETWKLFECSSNRAFIDIYSTQGIRCGLHGGKIQRWLNVCTDYMLLTWLKSNSSVLVLYLSDFQYIFYFFMLFCFNHRLIYVIVACYPRCIDVALWQEKSGACVFLLRLIFLLRTELLQTACNTDSFLLFRTEITEISVDKFI